MWKKLFGFSKNNPAALIIAGKDLDKSSIVHTQITDFSSYLRLNNADRSLCIQQLFQLLPAMPDDKSTSDLFELLQKKFRLKPQQLSTIISRRLSSAILEKEFDLCERILHLPFPSMKITLPTYEITQLIHHCPQSTQIIRCLSILIEKNLRHDSEYLSWILIILIEDYQIGDEIIIEHLLTLKPPLDLLTTCYGNNNVTPLMLFLHLYSSNKLQILIDHYLSNINQPSILLQCDKWNRSYLMHLLCGRCHHEIDENALQCPHSSAILERFSMLTKLGNRFDTPMKTILISEYCFPLRMALIKNFSENNPSFEVPMDELFQYFPSKFIPIYAENLKTIVKNRNLNSVLVSQLQLQVHSPHQSIDNTLKFLLQQGARIEKIDQVHQIIYNLLAYNRSIIPFLLLDYSFYINITFDMWPSPVTPTINLYICRVLQCGYPSEFRTKFDEFKSRLLTQTVKSIETFLDVKTPPNLSKLCLQKLRSSLVHLGDETIDRLKDYLPIHLRQSIVHYGYDQCQPYFHSVVSFS